MNIDGLNFTFVDTLDSSITVPIALLSVALKLEEVMEKPSCILLLKMLCIHSLVTRTFMPNVSS